MEKQRPFNERVFLKSKIKELEDQLSRANKRIEQLEEALNTEVEDNKDEPEIIIDRTIFPA